MVSKLKASVLFLTMSTNSSRKFDVRSYDVLVDSDCEVTSTAHALEIPVLCGYKFVLLFLCVSGARALAMIRS